MLLLAGGIETVAQPSAPDEAPVPQFTDATKAAGIDYRNVCGLEPEEKGWIMEGMGAGAAWLDYDGDGKLDLYIVNGSKYDQKPDAGEPNQLYRGNGKGVFVNVTEKSGAGDRGWGYGVAVGDIDNDGDPDIYVTNNGPNVLLLNNGDGTFKDITAKAGVAGLNVWSTSTGFIDIDNDGDLDLYVGNYMIADRTKVARRASDEADAVACAYRGVAVYCGPMGQVPVQDVLYRNDGDGRFTDVTRESGVWLQKPRFCLGVAMGDFDNDGLQDIYVANDSVQNSLWKSRGDGTFVDVGVMSLAGLNGDGRPQAGMGTAFGDYNGDGWLDIVVCNFSYDLNTVYRNLGGKMYLDDSAAVGLGVTNMSLSWGTGFYDFDLDTDLDLFIANGHLYPEVDGHDLGTRFRQENHLFINRGNRFVESSSKAGPGFAVLRSFRGAAFGDHDDDGDIDIFVVPLDDVPLLLRNEGTPGRHYLRVMLEGTRSNRDGLGARVTLTSDGRKQIRERASGGSYLSSSDPRLHFGLGATDRVERIEVRWPSGTRDVLTNVEVDRTITIREGSTKAAPER